MSLTETLNTALTGLSASQAGLKSVSQNIANVNTPGYARQRTTLSPMVLGGRTAGVRIGNVERIADKFLEAASFSAAGDVGRFKTISDYSDRLQGVLGQPGDANSLPAKMDAIGGAAVKLTTAGITPVTQRAFVDAVGSGLLELRGLGTDIEKLKQDADTEIHYEIDRINTLLKRVETLNKAISAGIVTDRAPAAYIDQRVSALDELGQLVKINTREQSDGQVYVELPNGVALVDTHARALSYAGADASISQPVYQPITVSFIDQNGSLKPTGEKLEVGTVGGKLGGLLDTRDRVLVQAEIEAGKVYLDMATAMNQVSNAGSSVPAPRTMEGRSTGLLATDALNFTGSTTFATVDKSGKVLAKVQIDYATLGAGATIGDAVAAINAGLGGTATASFTGGQLTLQATNSAQGVAIAENPANPGSRGGYGFSHFFGMNDVVRAEGMSSIASGLTYADSHGFPAGQTVDFAVRDGSGRVVAKHTLSTGVGSTVGDLVSDLNASPMASLGSFALDPQGRLTMTPYSGSYSLIVAADGTARTGTDARLSDMLGTGDRWGVEQLKEAGVRKELVADSSKLPFSQLNPNAAVGEIGVLSGDLRLASQMADALTGVADTNGVGKVSLERSVTNYVGRLSLEAARYQESSADASARHDDITLRRENISGVNIDEELGQMLIYQNSYGAAARLVTAAQSMFDQLLQMV